MCAKSVAPQSPLDVIKARNAEAVAVVLCVLTSETHTGARWLGSDSSVACDRDGVMLDRAVAQRAYKYYATAAEKQGLTGMCRSCFNTFAKWNYELVRAQVEASAKGEPTDWFVPMEWCGGGR
jgi:hypothetical protein